MPTRFTTDYPPPTDKDEFEDMVRDICALEWGDPDTQRYGRSGQKQYGVDVFGRVTGGDGSFNGAQCKLRTGGKQLSKKEIECEVNQAKSFPLGQLDRLVIATSSPRDIRTQETIAAISTRETNQGGFKVTGLFWGDITHRLAAYPGLILKYYRDYFSAVTNAEFVERLIDIPMTVWLCGPVDDYSARLSQQIRAYGLNIISETDGMGGSHIQPDGHVYVSKGTPSPREIDKLVADVYSARGSADSSCPVFIIISPEHGPGVLRSLENLKSDVRGISVLSRNAVPQEVVSTIFQSVVRYGYHRRGEPKTVNIVAKSMSYQASSALIDLDWAFYFESGSFPSAQVWTEQVIPVIKEVADSVARLKHMTRIQVDSKLYLPAAVATGFYLNLRTVELGVWVRTSGVGDFKHRFWLSNADQSNTTFAQVLLRQPKNHCKTAIVELSTSVGINHAVTDFATQQGLDVDTWVCVQPPQDYDMRRIEESDAVAFAEQVGRLLRQLNAQGVTDTHLFMRTPSALGILIGQRLQACGRIHLYWFQNPSYTYAFTLS